MLGNWRFRLRNRGRSAREVWEQSTEHELGYWREEIAGNAESLLWRHDRSERGELDRPFWDVVAEHPRDELSVLDVGAGPITPLAKDLPGKTLRLTAVDALADEYDRMLAGAGITPVVRTRQCHGEELLDTFPARSFDVAHSGNALDHSYDPMKVIRNMVELVKDDGAVVLRHHRNEGQYGLYRGLHQWNFDVRDGALLIWNGKCDHNVSDLLADVATVESWLEGDEVISVLRPRVTSRSR
jgi:SAM-dependent methyltransferase